MSVIEKLFNSSGQINFHAIYSYCQAYIEKFSKSLHDIYCVSCAKLISANSFRNNFFITIDVSSTVLKLLEKHDIYYDNIIRCERTSGNIETIRDIYDGKMYRDFVNSLKPSDRYLYAIAVFNTDGVPVFQGSKCSI